MATILKWARKRKKLKLQSVKGLNKAFKMVYFCTHIYFKTF